VEAGRRIGKYVLDERIAVGGMAEVWAAHVEGREGFVKPVALKFILESFSGDPELERLFVNEARIAARLQHANLVTVFDFDKVGADEGGDAGRHYIAMERVEGQDLRRIVEAARRAGYVFPVSVALYVAGEVLKALRYVHERREAGVALGLVHRDVSPHNVLVGYTGEVKLSDFGIAKVREPSARSTMPGSLRGKIAYAAPEQLAGGGVDHRVDQFAAGVTIWELCAGRKLFDGASDLEIIGKVARCEIPPLAQLARGDVPPAVEAALRRMLAAEPGARFRTTADALAAVLALPGYSPDGAPLGELVRVLFTSSGAGLSRTVPLPRADAAGAPTRTMDDAPPAAGLRADAPDAATKTPTRAAKRTTEALARSPAAGRSDGTTTDVRSRGAARLVGALVVAGAIAAAFIYLRPAGPRAAASPPIAAPAPRPQQAPPTIVAPVQSAPIAVPVQPAPIAVPVQPAPIAAAVPDPIAPEPGPRRSARGAADRHRPAHRTAPTLSGAEAPAARPARAADAPPATTSPYGAPIIE
jgi:serine/threonine-protein kinase